MVPGMLEKCIFQQQKMSETLTGIIYGHKRNCDSETTTTAYLRVNCLRTVPR